MPPPGHGKHRYFFAREGGAASVSCQVYGVEGEAVAGVLPGPVRTVLAQTEAAAVPASALFGLRRRGGALDDVAHEGLIPAADGPVCLRAGLLKRRA